MLQNTMWNEFFLDSNVRFPKFPKLVTGISIYDAPYGLGIQFRGGPKKLVIKGNTSSNLFKALRPELSGDKTLEEILDLLKSHDINDVANVLKILHAHNLLVDGAEEAPQHDRAVDPQLPFFERIVGRTGFNTNGKQIADSLKNTKVLLIGSEGLVPSFLHNFSLSGIRNVGLMYYQTDNIVENYDDFFPQPLMASENITGMDETAVLNALHIRAEDYQYVVVGFENPNRAFLSAINDFCIGRNIPAVFLSLSDNTFEVGPYVIPKATSCYVCSILRKNSYNQDALFDNIYHDGLASEKHLVDNAIKGTDLVSNNIATGLLASDLMKIITGYSQPTLLNHITEYDTISGQVANYPVFRVPGCISCSN